MKKFVLILLVAMGAVAEERSFEVGTSPKLELSNISGNIEFVPGNDGLIVVDWTRTNESIEVKFSQKGDKVEVEVEYPKNFRGQGDVNFKVKFPSKGDLEVQSVSGNINVSDIDGDLELNTVSGSITASQLGGKVDLNSVSGSLTLGNMGSGSVSGNTVSGSLTYSGPVSDNDYEFNSTSGSIEITLSGASNFTAEGNSLSGDIKTDVNGLAVTKEKYTGSKELTGTLGDGSGKLEVNTISGNIEIH